MNCFTQTQYNKVFVSTHDAVILHETVIQFSSFIFLDVYIRTALVKLPYWLSTHVVRFCGQTLGSRLRTERWAHSALLTIITQIGAILIKKFFETSLHTLRSAMQPRSTQESALPI